MYIAWIWVFITVVLSGFHPIGIGLCLMGILFVWGLSRDPRPPKDVDDEREQPRSKRRQWDESVYRQFDQRDREPQQVVYRHEVKHEVKVTETVYASRPSRRPRQQLDPYRLKGIFRDLN